MCWLQRNGLAIRGSAQSALIVRIECPVLGVKQTSRKRPRMSAYDPKRKWNASFCCPHRATAPHQPALWNPPRARRIFYPRCAREITAAKDDQLAFWWTHRVADRVGFIRRNRSNTAGAAAPGRASATAPPNADSPRRIRHSGESLDGFESAEARVCARHHWRCRAAKHQTVPTASPSRAKSAKGPGVSVHCQGRQHGDHRQFQRSARGRRHKKEIERLSPIVLLRR